MYIEVQNYMEGRFLVDNFEMLYTYFRFPLYWVIGLAQLVILGSRLPTKKIEKEDSYRN